MAAGGDCVELVHEQTYLGQTVNNVYYFEAVTTTPISDLTDWFEAAVVPVIKVIQNSETLHVNLRARNLFNLAETHEEPLTGTGAVSAGLVELPSFMAFTMRLDHENGAVRPGFKRWVGMGEAAVENALLVTAYVTNMEDIGDELINPPATSNPNWAHVIVNRICEEPNPVPNAIPRCLRYRLPENQGEFNPGYPIGYEIYSQPTTQNSRKWYT